MNQPVKKAIKVLYNDAGVNPIYTLIIDGNNLIKKCMVDPKVNTRGQHIGAIFQFILQLKLMLKKKDWDFVYVMWDGPNSGVLRYNIYEQYKANRDKTYETTQFDKDNNEYVKRIINFSKKRKIEEDKVVRESEKDQYDRERLSIMKCLEELFIRQVMVEDVEGDDLMAYYVLNKQDNEKIVILTEDGDLAQLINKDVCIYSIRLKDFITEKNFYEKFGYSHENVLISKILTGDVSDNIKGIKGLGNDTLIKIMPEIKKNKVTLEDIISRARDINIERKFDKKKPLIACDNIVNSITDGIQGTKIYEINEKIINLKKPLITDNAKEELDAIMYAPIDPDGRSLKNLYRYIIADDITELLDSNKFSTFFSDFKRIENKEKIYAEKCS